MKDINKMRDDAIAVIELAKSIKIENDNTLSSAIEMAQNMLSLIQDIQNPWNVGVPPAKNKSYICRLDNGFIQLCQWANSKWNVIWGYGEINNVTEWMEIPYNKMEAKSVVVDFNYDKKDFTSGVCINCNQESEMILINDGRCLGCKEVGEQISGAIHGEDKRNFSEACN